MPEKEAVTIKFGKLLREAREKRHLTQDELAFKVGVSVKAIQHWEAGRRWMNSPSVFSELDRALGVSTTDLLKQAIS